MLGGLVAALVVCEVLLRLYIVPFDGRWPGRIHLVYTAENPDVVIGDSHFYRGFATQDDFVNLSRGGTSPASLEIISAEYFRHLAPGRVIVQAGPQLLRAEMQEQGAQGHERYFGQNRLPLPFALYVFEPGITVRARWLFELPRVVNQTAFERRRKVPGNGFDARAKKRMASYSRPTLLEYTMDVLEDSRPVPNVRESSGYAAYRRMLGLLKERGADLCMLEAPVSPLFEELAAKDVRFIEARLAFRELASELGIRFVDDEDLDASFDASAFIDTDHLAADAADVFAPAAVRACFGEGR